MKIYPDTHLAAGRLLEHYQLIRRLDKRYGIEIWHAQHLILQVPVVLKILLSAHQDDEVYQRSKRFLQNEARVLSGLHHQYIIGYRDYIEGRNFCMLVLEYAPYGSIVHHHGSGRKIPLYLVHLYIAQVSRALSSLHRHGQIHRDVKPGNILLLGQHHAVLADFELVIDHPAHGYLRKRYTGGTAPYMAPEQRRGAPCAASDQYSLAICAYEWLTGHRPFSSGGGASQVQRTAHIPRSVRIERPELPTAVDRVMWTALHPDPAQRYPGIIDFARTLIEVTRQARPPLVKRWPYYRSVHGRRVSQVDDLPSTMPRWRESGGQHLCYLPMAVPV